jgi:hypothetical protein
MIPQRRSRTLQIALLLCCLAKSTHAYAQSSSSETVYHLHGTVVNGITGKPLARSLLQSGDHRIAVMTDSEGRFAVDLSVPAKTSGATNPNSSGHFGNGFGNGIFLMVQKPGYIPAEQITHLPLDETLSSTDVKLKLMPAASISGHISAAGADSAADVRVLLLLHQVDDDGRRGWLQSGFHNTNSRGDFQFTNLQPGEYTIMTSEWRGDQPLPPQRTAITQQYPPVFYGDQQSLATAAKLQLHYGDIAQAEFHLHLATYYPVTVPVAAQSANSPVNARLTDDNAFTGFQLGYNSRDGAVEGSLPNGHYSLLLSGYVPQQTFALMPLNVDGAPVRTAAVALAPAGKILVRIRTQFTQQASGAQNAGGVISFSGATNNARTMPLVQLLLRSEDSAGGYSGNSNLAPNSDEVVLQNIQPGSYFVHPQSFRGYVASMTSGGVDLLQHPLVITSAGTADPIDVTLRDDTATLTGTVTTASDQPPQNARFSRSFAGPDGKFTVTNLVPGSYRVLAFRSMQRQIPYRDPEAMHQYDGKGSTITAAPGQQVTVAVSLLDDAEAENN